MEVRRLKEDELYHHGVKGQKWGVRRYQNADGSLTPEGRKHYDVGSTVKKGMKIGAAAGTAYGAALGASVVAALVSFGIPATAPIAIGYAAAYTAMGAIGGLQTGAAAGAGIGIGRQYAAKKKGIKLGDIDHQKQIADFDKKWNINQSEREWDEKWNNKGK